MDAEPGVSMHGSIVEERAQALLEPTAITPTLPGRVSRRLGWGIADQALSSGTNFALGILAARSLNLTDFGAFSLAFAVYALALGVSRAVATDPLVVRYSAAQEDRWRSATASACGTALSMGSVIGAGCVAIGLTVGGPPRAAFVTLGTMMPGLLLQDCWRFAFFAHGRGKKAFMNDLVWLLVLLPFFAMLIALGRMSVVELILVWGGAASVAGAFGVRQAHVLPNPLRSRRWIREQVDLAPRFLGEAILIGGAAQLWTFAVGAIAGLATVGMIRAGLILLGPLNVVFMGFGMVAIPEGVRLLAHDPSRLRHGAARLSVGLAGSALAWGCMILLLPSQLGIALLASAWIPARHLAIPLTLLYVGAGIQKGADVGLRALASAKRSLRTRIAEASLTVTGPVAGVALAGAQGAAWGLAAAYLLEGALWWWQFLSELRIRGPQGSVVVSSDEDAPGEHGGSEP